MWPRSRLGDLRGDQPWQENARRGKNIRVVASNRDKKNRKNALSEPALWPILAVKKQRNRATNANCRQFIPSFANFLLILYAFSILLCAAQPLRTVLQGSEKRPGKEPKAAGVEREREKK